MATQVPVSLVGDYESESDSDDDPSCTKTEDADATVPRELERELRRSGVQDVKQLATVSVDGAKVAGSGRTACTRATAGVVKSRALPSRPVGVSKAARRTHHITALAAAARVAEEQHR